MPLRMTGLTVTIACIVLSAVGTAPETALADQYHISIFNARYPSACRDLSQAMLKCILCHESEEKLDLNAYGRDIAAALNHDPINIEGADSDGDGLTNLQEIEACTLPWDPSSFSVPTHRIDWGTIKAIFDASAP